MLAQRSKKRHCHKHHQYKHCVSSIESDLDLSDSDDGLLNPLDTGDASYTLNIAAKHDEEGLYSHGKTYFFLFIKHSKICISYTK